MANWMGHEAAKKRLTSVAPRARVALASACGERVYQVYDKHWVGDHYPAVKEAVEFGWKHACESEEIDTSSRTRLLASLKDVVEYLNEEGITILASSATVSLRIVEAITANENDAIVASARALGSALYVAQMAGSCSGGDEAESFADKEETEWQKAVIQVVESWTGPCQRLMFAKSGPMPPKWLLAYEAGSQYY